MAFALRPPDFFRLFEDDATAKKVVPPRTPEQLAAAAAAAAAAGPGVALPSTASSSGAPPFTYTMFGGVYSHPPAFVPDLASVGREQLYDEAAFHTPGGAKAELKRLAAEIQTTTVALMRALAKASPDIPRLSSRLELLFINASHLLGRLRERQAWAEAVDMAAQGRIRLVEVEAARGATSGTTDASGDDASGDADMGRGAPRAANLAAGGAAGYAVAGAAAGRVS